MLNIKNKLNNFVVKIGEEPNNFAKCVVIYDYMDFVHKNDKLRKVLQNIIDDIPTQISLFMEREITLCEADLFDSKIELVNNDWTHYVILSNMYYLLREYVKESKARRAFLDKELDKGFSLPYSREQFELSLKAFNQKLSHAIDKEFFVSDNDEARKISFDDKRSILNLYGEKIKITKRNNTTVQDVILKYMFIKNPEALGEEFFYSEIAQDEYKDEAYNWRKYHVACTEIQRKIKEQTQNNLDNFLLFDTGKSGKISLNQKCIR